MQHDPYVSLSFSKENGIYRIQSAFEIMGLNEHTKFCGLTKNRYSRYKPVLTVPERYTAKMGVCITKRLWFYGAGGCLTPFSQKQVSEIPQSTQSKQTSPLKHPRHYIVHENTPILIVLINTLTSNTTEQISPKSPNLLKHLDRLPKHSKIYAEQQSLFSLCTYMC